MVLCGRIFVWMAGLGYCRGSIDGSLARPGRNFAAKNTYFSRAVLGRIGHHGAGVRSASRAETHELPSCSGGTRTSAELGRLSPVEEAGQQCLLELIAQEVSCFSSPTASGESLAEIGRLRVPFGGRKSAMRMSLAVASGICRPVRPGLDPLWLTRFHSKGPQMQASHNGL